ncbi:DUF5060 domain-containing protein [Tardisphaera saccharovorans]
MKYALITIFLLVLIPVASASGQGTNTQATLGYPILLKFRASTSYENPLNTTQVNVTAFFSSQGSSFSLPCYPYAKGIWGVRFTPTALSTYTYRVVLTNSSGAFVIGGGEILVSAGPKPMPEAEAGKSYFHAGGSPLVLVGEDVAWASSPGDSAGGWEYYVGKLAKNGGNWVRLWSPYAATWFSGNYSAMLDFALKNHVYVQLCLFSPYTDQSFYEGPEWFNVAPAAFFSSPKMIKLEEFWIRSLIGKYSAFPNLFSWELFNEVDGAPGYNSTAVAAWTRAMVSYIEKNDPYRHMITISVSNPEEGFSLFSIPGISYAQLHLYGSGPYAIPSNISYWVGQYMSFHKPILVAEFGASYISAVNDPVGISLQLGLWSAVASGSAGTAMTWWWDSFVDPNDLYFQFQAVRNLVSQLNFSGFRPLDVSSSSGSAEAVGNGTAALIFLVNSSLASDWANYYELGRATSAKVALRMQPGSYWLERWNPTTGSVTNASVITVGESGAASFSLSLSSDAVITITKDRVNATPASSSFGTLSFFSTSAVPVYIYSRDRLLIEEVRANERGTNVSLPYGYYLVNQSKVVLDHQSSPMIFYYSPFIAYSTLTLSQAKVPEGEALTLTCALVSANGTPVSGALVNFYANGTLVASAKTNGTGLASAAYAPSSEGKYVITIGLPNSIISPLMQIPHEILTVTLPQLTLTLSASPNSTIVGSSVTLIAHAAYVNGTPVSGALVNFYANGTLVASAKTNGTGDSTLTYKPPLGATRVSAILDGVTSTTSIYASGASAALYLYAIAVIAAFIAIAIAAVGYILRRKRQGMMHNKSCAGRPP